MPRRELFALVAAPFLIAVLIWLPPWVFVAVVGAVVTAAGSELLSMARKTGIACGRWLPLALLAGLLAAAWLYGIAGLAVAAVAAVMVLPAAQLGHRKAPQGSLAGVAVSCFVVLFLGLAGGCIGWLRLWPEDGLAVRLLLLFFGTIWVGDSGAYYIGSRLGRHRMSPQISPNKTWEGLAGGTVTSYGAAAALNVALGVGLPWPHLLAVATILAVAAPLGDLVESQFKRDTGVKDSSSLLPGHGGLLDRTDSLLYAAPPVLGYLLVAGLLA